MTTTQDAHVWTLYASDAGHALFEVEQALLALESAPGSAAEVHRIYRSLHTLKGNSALLSLAHIESLAHAAEEVMTMVHDGLLTVDDAADLRVRDALSPLLRLCEYYAGEPCSGEGIAGSVVVVAQTARRPLGLPVETLLGNRPVMLKPLTGVIARVRAAVGRGMLRSGEVALPLDCEQIHG